MSEGLPKDFGKESLKSISQEVTNFLKKIGSVESVDCSYLGEGVFKLTTEDGVPIKIKIGLESISVAERPAGDLDEAASIYSVVKDGHALDSALQVIEEVSDPCSMCYGHVDRKEMICNICKTSHAECTSCTTLYPSGTDCPTCGSSWSDDSEDGSWG